MSMVRVDWDDLQRPAGLWLACVCVAQRPGAAGLAHALLTRRAPQQATQTLENGSIQMRLHQWRVRNAIPAPVSLSRSAHVCSRCVQGAAKNNRSQRDNK